METWGWLPPKKFGLVVVVVQEGVQSPPISQMMVVMGEGLSQGRIQLRRGGGGLPQYWPHTSKPVPQYFGAWGQDFGPEAPPIRRRRRRLRKFGQIFQKKSITQNVILSQILEKISPPASFSFYFVFFILVTSFYKVFLR